MVTSNGLVKKDKTGKQCKGSGSETQCTQSLLINVVVLEEETRGWYSDVRGSLSVPAVTSFHDRRILFTETQTE